MHESILLGQKYWCPDEPASYTVFSVHVNRKCCHQKLIFYTAFVYDSRLKISYKLKKFKSQAT